MCVLCLCVNRQCHRWWRRCCVHTFSWSMWTHLNFDTTINAPDVVPATHRNMGAPTRNTDTRSKHISHSNFRNRKRKKGVLCLDCPYACINQGICCRIDLTIRRILCFFHFLRSSEHEDNMLVWLVLKFGITFEISLSCPDSSAAFLDWRATMSS